MDAAPFRFGDIHLLDYALAMEDGSLQVELIWGTQTAVAGDYRLFVHVVDANGEIITQIDPPPGAYPIALWGGGERITQAFTVPLDDDDVLPGDYSVRIGLYDPASFVRLPARTASGDALPDDAAPLGDFTRR